MNTTNYADQIVKNLESKGCSKDYIIGFLSSTLEGVKNTTDHNFIKSIVKYTTMIDNSKHTL